MKDLTQIIHDNQWETFLAPITSAQTRRNRAEWENRVNEAIQNGDLDRARYIATTQLGWDDGLH